MLFGIRLIGYLGDANRLIELGVLAEKSGFDFCWFPHDPFMRNPWTLMAALAKLTNKIKLGVVGTNPYTTDLSEIATHMATLQELSAGRGVLGFGLHTEEMVRWLGYDASDIEGRLREGVSILRALFRGENAGYKGKFYKWSDECYLRFTPQTKTPIYIAGYSRSTHALSGELGDGSLPMLTPPDAADYVVRCVKEGAEKAGKRFDEIDIAGLCWASISESSKVAEETLKRMIAYFGPYLEAEALAKINLTPHDFDEIKKLVSRGYIDKAIRLVNDSMLRLAIIGGAKELIEVVDKLRKVGISQISIGGPLGPDPEEAIQIVGKKVIPYFKENV